MEGKEVIFEVIEDIYWDNWGHFLFWAKWVWPVL